MADLSHLSDADLEAIATGKPAAGAAPPARDLSHMSDDDLQKIAGKQPMERGTFLPVGRDPETGKNSWAVPGVVKSLVDTIMLPGDVATGKTTEDSPDYWDRVVNAGAMIGTGPRAGKGLVTPEGKAVPKPVVRALKSDGIDPAQIPAKTAELGPEGVTGDLGPNLQSQTAAVATMPGKGQKTVVDALSERKAGAPERIRGALDEHLGEAPIPSEVEAGLKDGKKALSPEYDAVLGKAGPVDTSSVAADLDAAIPTLRGDAQTALLKVRKMLDKVGAAAPTEPALIIDAEKDPAKKLDLLRRHLAGEALTAPQPLDDTARTLFETRKAIDGLASSTTDSNVQRVLTETRQKIDATLGAAAPGIKDLDAKYAGIAQTGQNFEKGQTVLGNGRETPRPAELEADMATANQPLGNELGPTTQARALTQGARAEIDRIVGTNLNDRAALNGLLKGEGDWNYDRLSTLFGKDRTDAIYKVLDNERVMADTENRAMANSKTAAVTAAQKEVEAGKGPSVSQAAGDFHFGTAGKAIVDKIMGGIADKRIATRNGDMADVLMGRDPLKPNTVGGQQIPAGALVDAVMRPNKAAPPDAAARRKFLNDQRSY